MNLLIPLPLIALVAGAAVSTQAALNTQLAMMVKNSMLATVVAFFSSLLFATIAFILLSRDFPNIQTLKSVPPYLWFAGGFLSAFGIGLFYWLIPQMGVGAMISCALTGQLLLAMIAGHFGWFQLPVVPISFWKLTGSLLLISGTVLINKG